MFAWCTHKKISSLITDMCICCESQHRHSSTKCEDFSVYKNKLASNEAAQK